MNLTPDSWIKSEVSEYKNFVKVGTILFCPGGSFGVVLEKIDDEILFKENDDTNSEFIRWYNLNDLQLGWYFSKKYLEFIKSIN